MKLVQHLKDRGMDPSLYNYAKSYSATAITFYLHNLSGQIVGWQRYRPNKTEKKMNHPKMSRYYTYLPRGVDGVFGLEQLNPSDRTIYIVEGVFKAAVLHRLGYNSIAVLTAIRIMRQTWNLVAIGDNDPAGADLVRKVGKGFQSPVDLDDMSDYDIKELLENNT